MQPWRYRHDLLPDGDLREGVTMLFLVAGSAVLLLGAIGVLLWAVIPTVAELKRTIREGTGSTERLKGAVAAIRNEQVLLQEQAVVLSGMVASWTRVSELPVEIRLLVKNIQSIGTVTALLSAARLLPGK